MKTMTWEDVLDDIEARVAAGAAALDADEIFEMDDFIPPVNLGPLPVELQGRAEASLQANAELIERFTAARAAVQTKLSTTATPAAARAKSQYNSAPIPMYVDRSV